MTLKQKWWEWHKENPHVWKLFVKYSLIAVEAGHKKMFCLVNS